MSSTVPPIGGDQNRGPELIAVTWVFTALAAFVVSLRLFTRVRILKETGLDDIFTVLSLVSSRSHCYPCLTKWSHTFLTEVEYRSSF